MVRRIISQQSSIQSWLNTTREHLKNSYWIITWGYTKLDVFSTNEFRVIHKPWHIYPVTSFDVKLNATSLYGKEFGPWLNRPFNIFLMDGSETKVTRPIRL
jgi:hypothetical protein